jgi:hypothetical protein
MLHGLAFETIGASVINCVAMPQEASAYPLRLLAPFPPELSGPLERLVRPVVHEQDFACPSSSVEHHGVTNSYCSRRYDHSVDASAGELA